MTGVKISVVVCVWNVEQYLRECLESIAEQTFTDFECIVCDDESSDASGLIAKHFAESDPRFRYVWQENRGPGPAGGRNGGIPHITGERVMFVDSDDVLLPNALELMWNSAEATGSDMVIGAVDRFNSSGRWPSFLHQRVHRSERVAVTAAEYPEMVWDSTAWNKLMTTSLWQEHIGLFDEGRLYEDLYPMIRMMTLSNHVDILTDTIYLWREREAGTSVTQMVASTKGLEDKIDQMLKLDRFLVEHGHTQVKAAQDAKLLEADIKWMLDDLDRSDHNYQEAFWRDLPELIAAMTPDVMDEVAPSLQSQYRAILAGDRGELQRLRLERAASSRPVVPADHVGGPVEMRLFARCDRVEVSGAGLRLRGSMALDRNPIANAADATATVWVEAWESGRRLEFPVTLGGRPRLHLNNSGAHLHRNTGFDVTIPFGELGGGSDFGTNWMVGAALELGDTALGESRIKLAENVSKQLPPAQRAGDVLARAYVDDWDNLSIFTAEPDDVTVELDDTRLVVHGSQAPLSLLDVDRERRWASQRLTDGAAWFDLAQLPDGIYRVEQERTAALHHPRWVPVVAVDPGQLDAAGSRATVCTYGDAGVSLRCGDDTSGEDPLARWTEKLGLRRIVQAINARTWI